MLKLLIGLPQLVNVTLNQKTKTLYCGVLVINKKLLLYFLSHQKPKISKLNSSCLRGLYFLLRRRRRRRKFMLIDIQIQIYREKYIVFYQFVWYLWKVEAMGCFPCSGDPSMKKREKKRIQANNQYKRDDQPKPKSGFFFF